METATEKKIIRFLPLILAVLCIAAASVLIGAILLRKPAETSLPSVIIPKDLILGETVALFPRESGGFVMVSSSDTETCVTFLSQTGAAEQDGENAPRTFSGRTERAVVSGHTLYLFGTDLDGSCFLGELPLNGAALSKLSVTAFSDKNRLDLPGVCVEKASEPPVFCAVAGKTRQAVRFTAATLDSPEPIPITEDVQPVYLAVNDSTVLLRGRNTDGDSFLYTGAMKNGAIAGLREGSGAAPEFPLTFLTDTVLMDHKNRFYRFSNDELQTAEAQQEKIQLACACASGKIAAASENRLLLYDASDLASPVQSRSFDGQIRGLCASGPYLLALIYDPSADVFRSTVLEEVDLFEETGMESDTEEAESGGIPVHSEPENSGETESTEESASSEERSSENEEPPMEPVLHSDRFVIDPLTRQVELPPGTTLAAFKKTLSRRQSEALSAYDPEGHSVSGGVLGTACTLQLEENGKVLDTAEVIVYGDLNGNGVVNSADVRALFRHLTGRTPLQGAQYTAADLDRDQIVDTRDLLFLQSQ